MRKHTSGPWVAVEVGQGGPADNPMPVYEIRSADERAVIAEYVDAWNAPILAAAPELLKVLQESVALADKNCPQWNDAPHRTAECQAIYDKCVAAIRKATGG